MAPNVIVAVSLKFERIPRDHRIIILVHSTGKLTTSGLDPPFSRTLTTHLKYWFFLIFFQNMCEQFCGYRIFDYFR
jgi:hypothetical protein